MRIVCVATALAGCEPSVVAQAVSTGWAQLRPADEVITVVSSDGENVAHIGTGLAQVFCQHDDDAQPYDRHAAAEPRRMVWVAPRRRRALIDLAEALSWSGGTDPRGSTSFLARDLRWLIEQGITSVRIHLPTLMSHSDAGIGLVSELAGCQISYDSHVGELAGALTQARRALGELSVQITYPHDQELVGFSGVARAWQQHGMPADLAQAAHRDLSAFVHTIEQIQQRENLLAGEHSPSRASDGVGGGLGKIFAALHGRLAPIGQQLVLPTPEPDLYLYVCQQIGQALPAGLLAVSERAEVEGVPLVVITIQTQLIRGELPRLGIHGLYRLPEHEGTILAQDLSQLSVRLATTWGWD